MPRTKPSAPRRASEETRRALNWNLGESAAPLVQSLPEIIVSDEDEDQPSKPKAKRRSSKRNSVAESPLQLLLNQCDFYLTLKREHNEPCVCVLGSISVILSDEFSSAELLQHPEFWLYVSEVPTQSLLYFEWLEDSGEASLSSRLQVKYCHVNLVQSYDILRQLQTKQIFLLRPQAYNAVNRTLCIDILLRDTGLTRLNYASEATRAKPNVGIQKVMETLYKIRLPDYFGIVRNTKHDNEILFAAIKSLHPVCTDSIAVQVQHPSLIPQLRPYQADAVRWMLRQEEVQDTLPDHHHPGSLHELYEQLTTPDGKTLYYNKYGGYLVEDKPLKVRRNPGGILADEMGLGKTVEVLACILCHPRCPTPLDVLDTTETSVEDTEVGDPCHQDRSCNSVDIFEDSPDASNLVTLQSSSAVIQDIIKNLESDEDASSMSIADKTSFVEDKLVVPVTTIERKSHVTTVPARDDSFQHMAHNDGKNIGNCTVEMQEIRMANAQLCTHNSDRSHPEAECSTTPKVEMGVIENTVLLNAKEVASFVVPREEKDRSLVPGIHEHKGNQHCSALKHKDLKTPEGATKTIFKTGSSCRNGKLCEEPSITNSIAQTADPHQVCGSEKIGITVSNINVKASVSPQTSKISSEGLLKNKLERENNQLSECCDQLIDHSIQKRSLQDEEASNSFSVRWKRSRNDGVAESAREFAKQSVAPKAFFECICGSVDNIVDKKPRIQCSNCSLWQHMDCVKYNSSMGVFYCPHCWVARPPVRSRATLIVSPAIIQCQWVDEIQRHLRHKSLRILVYTGVHKHGFIQPQSLANHDVVLTSYETLRKEIDYVDLPHSNSEAGRRFRHPKRFMAIPSPLVAVDWWRVCLDEAQMVECTTTKTAEMALRLSAVNRWCVTGTPIQKSIADLYGLLLFLGADPYWVKAWWRDCLFEPYCHGVTDSLHHVIAQYLWRSAKMDVIDQINIPQQTEEVHWLNFSPIEEHFYNQLHIECAHDALARLNKVHDLDVLFNSVDRHTLHQILAPLLRLRQACCHPQAVRGQFMSVHKSTMTMDELLKSLIKKTTTEAEEAHRQHVAALNGLASLHVIKEEWTDAVEVYREVLRLAEEHSQHIKTDKLQRLHALHNLAELLDAGHANIPPTLRDGSLKVEAEELRSVYLTKCASKVANSQETLNSAQATICELRSQFSCSFPWWASLLDVALGLGNAEDIVYRVKNDLTETSGSHKRVSVANRFTDIRGLKYVVTTLFDDLQAAHAKLTKAVLALNPQPSQEDLNAAVECHLRPTERNPPMCTYCKVHELFNKYETKLFSFRDEEDRFVAEPSTKDDAMMLGLRKGTWADSELETVVKTILTYAKSHNWGGIEVDDGNVQVKLFDATKKEFRALRGVWMQIRDQVSAVDELGMATIRLRLRLQDEPKLDTPQPNILERSELEHHRMKLLSDRIVATNERKKKLGQLLYLQNLSKSDVGKRGGSNPEPCPVCQRTLGEQWSVLQCGHCFCIECIRVLTTRYSPRGRHCFLKCPICRQKTAPGEMSYVNTKDEDIEEEHIQVLGNHSTKVEAVVRILLQIQQKEPTAKSLVFSLWQEVLDVLAIALNENKITYRNLGSYAKLQASLTSFKKDPNVAVLLLPIHSGANGLNLIEATHVLLVEPELNLANELQAIGRVHRIGQTKSTVVHRFLVRGTIEERMNALPKSLNTSSWSYRGEESTVTLRDLRNLFVEVNILDRDNVEEDDNHEADSVILV